GRHPRRRGRRRARGAAPMRRTPVITLLLVGLSLAPLAAADWPSIFGPRRDNTSDQKGLLRTWPQAGPKVLWSTPMRAGFGGPAVSGGKIYLLDRDEA